MIPISNPKLIYVECVDCGISINDKKARELSKDVINEETPIFEVGSVLDWLDHRRHHTQAHQNKLKATYEKAVDKLNVQKRALEIENNDWADSKIRKL